jgi:hypothetical protein
LTTLVIQNSKKTSAALTLNLCRKCTQTKVSKGVYWCLSRKLTGFKIVLKNSI